jgi:hypothetical protein
MGFEQGKSVLRHQQFFRSKVLPSIVEEFFQNFVDDPAAVAARKRLLQFVNGVEQGLMLTVEDRNLHTVSLCPAKRARHFVSFSDGQPVDGPIRQSFR